MLIHGDLFDVLPTLEANSIDACVTDPPYGLGFMGKTWDTFKPGEAEKRIVPNAQIESDNPNLKGRTRGPASSPSAVEYDESVTGHEAFMRWTTAWAREVYRVLKPGAYLLVCGAPRSYHWMACGLEYAGFQIRDSCVYWGFGQGFPKSLNVSKDERFCQCQKERGEHGDAPVPSLREGLDADDALSSSAQQDVFAAVRGGANQGAASGTPEAANHRVRDLWLHVPYSAESGPTCGAANLLEEVQREDPREASGEVLGEYAGSEAQGPLAGGPESCVEGRSHLLQEARELQADQVRAMSTVDDRDGQERRLRDGASAGDGGMGRSPASQERGRSSRRSRSAAQRQIESGALAEQSKPQAPRRWPPCHRCGKPMVPAGLGTALKPAYEPIVVARKPVRGTVAANVETHGTGALNIDACRIETDGDDPNLRVNPTKSNGLQSCFGVGDVSYARGPAVEGRWPANVLLDEDAAEMLDAQSGELIGPGGPAKCGSASAWPGGEFQGRIYPGEVGGASRFFYVAKPDREERDYGCANLAEQVADAYAEHRGRRMDEPSRFDGKPLARGRNVHPTVKPVALMRWLVRLVTPLNGTVLDPFTGSGTTGMACRYEFREFIGIEREAEYLAIAERRIGAVAPLFAASVVQTGDHGAGPAPQEPT